jgi:hypothetical protein
MLALTAAPGPPGAAVEALTACRIAGKAVLRVD